jgi:uroporphyrin-3 C-methyltransferase
MNSDAPAELVPPQGPSAPTEAADGGTAAATLVIPATAKSAAGGPPPVSRALVLLLAVMAAGGLLLSGLLWQKLSNIQEALAKQSADSGTQAMEARASARQAQDLARDTAARLALTEVKVSEVALQRTQLDELMQSLSRSRDENLVVDIESAIRLAQQQAQLAGSVQPLLAALKSAEQRVQRAAQPRLASLQRAIARDMDRVKLTAVSDTPALLVKMDELVRLADELPVANAVATSSSMSTPKPIPAGDRFIDHWHQLLQVFGDEARKLVRVSKVEAPEAALLSPEQSFFLRENFKLRLLNARLGLLARQLDASRADLVAASTALQKYFDASSRKTQAAAQILQQVQQQMRALELPRVDDTLAALETAAAGK